MQRNNYLFFGILSFLLASLSSCDLIGGIFEAGVWTGLILVAIVIALVIWLISKFF